MRLVIDIGNTTLHAALCRGEHVQHEDRLVVRRRCDVGGFLDRFVGCGPLQIREVGVCSVDPENLARCLRWAGALDAPVRVVGRDLPVPLRQSYRDPRRLGIDRLVDAYGVRRRLPGDWVVVNLGTAVTVDAVTCGGEFHGGAILPGLRLSLESLSRGTAQLPEVQRLESPRFPTRSTEEAMASGILVGLAGMVDRVAETLARAIGIEARAVATGGDAARIAPWSRVIREVVPHLTILGILDLLSGGDGAPGEPPPPAGGP